VSTNTDLLGWILERSTGTRFADLLSNLLWQPMGAQTSAYITVDRPAAPRCPFQTQPFLNGLDGIGARWDYCASPHVFYIA
jgi:CubicO group peptidase (beta-lactamase class C family)